MKLLPMERAVLAKLLEGDFPLLDMLRLQLENCKVTGREMTGCGFFLNLAVPDDMPRSIGLDTQFGDVLAVLPGLENGAGFLLYLKDGLLDMLEGYSFDEPWPISTDVFELRYNNVRLREWGDMGAILTKK